MRRLQNPTDKTWYKVWLGLCGFDLSNLVPTSVSIGTQIPSDRHDLIPPPLAVIYNLSRP